MFLGVKIQRDIRFCLFFVVSQIRRQIYGSTTIIYSVEHYLDN